MTGLWYSSGLRFGCVQCGNCCGGPGEGYIWVNEQEIERIAQHLKLSTTELTGTYLRQVGTRYTIIEDRRTKDCIFLERGGGAKCRIYPVRPAQCRTWPFWPSNLTDETSWRMAGRRCPGINCGRNYTHQQIRQIMAMEMSVGGQGALTQAVGEIYDWIGKELEAHQEAGKCRACGRCCDFDKYGHKLYVTTPELEYLVAQLGRENVRQTIRGGCPWQEHAKCTIHKHRFSACRIFWCDGDAAFQSELTEQAIRRFKKLSEEFGIAYRYMELAAALKQYAANTGQSAGESPAEGRGD